MRARSFPTAFVSPITAALDAAYAAAIGLPSLPAIEARLTIRPYPRSTIPGITARLQKKTPSALIASTRFHSSSVTSTVCSERPGTPAQQTRTSTGPAAATAAFTSAELETSPAIAVAPSGASARRSSV